LPKLTNRSDFVVHRSVRNWTSRAYVFGLMTALCVVTAVRPSRAAGCHVQERPVLQSTLSWESDQKIGPATPIAQAPPVLAHPPCGGEIPLAASSSTLLLMAAVSESSVFQLPEICESILVHPRTEHAQPSSLRLDRPPRPNTSVLT
jgi:hypothetical protein